MYLRSKQQEFEYGERASKLLSHHLRQTTEANYIAEIQTAKGVTTDQLNINKQFKFFYEELYTSEPCDKANIASFFSKLEMPTISVQNKANLEQSISTVEIEQAIK